MKAFGIESIFKFNVCSLYYEVKRTHRKSKSLLEKIPFLVQDFHNIFSAYMTYITIKWLHQMEEFKGFGIEVAYKKNKLLKR